jgi:hypothetical protein
MLKVGARESHMLRKPLSPHPPTRSVSAPHPLLPMLGWRAKAAIKRIIFCRQIENMYSIVWECRAFAKLGYWRGFKGHHAENRAV